MGAEPKKVLSFRTRAVLEPSFEVNASSLMHTSFRVAYPTTFSFFSFLTNNVVLNIATLVPYYCNGCFRIFHMITINVLFFASAKEITGLSKCKVELEVGQTTSDFVSKLSVMFPGLNIERDQISIAVNQVYCKETKELHDGDTVALLPPISGG